MDAELNDIRRRAAEEAAAARNSTDEQAAAIHRTLSTEYLRRLSAFVEPAPRVQVAASL